MSCMKNIIIYLLIILLGSSCELTDPAEPEYSNSSKPKNNEIILERELKGEGYSEYIYSEKSKSGFYVVGFLDQSSITANTQVGDGIDFEVDGRPRLTKFDENGKEEWFFLPNFKIQRIEVIPPGMLGAKEFIIISGYDFNGVSINDINDRNERDRTRMMLLDDSGELVDSYQEGFFLTPKDIEIIGNTSSHLKFVSVGTTFYSDINRLYPKYFFFNINKSSLKFEFEEQIPLWDLDGDGDADEYYENYDFTNIKLHNNKFIIAGEYAKQGKIANRVFVMVVDPKSIYRWEIRQNYVNDDDYMYYNREGLLIHEGNVILTGFLEDQTKKKSSGIHYKSPFIISFNIASQKTNYYRSYVASDDPDYLYSAKIIDNKIVACGVQSRYYCSACDTPITVGNGWIFMVDPITGENLGEKSFGSDANRTVLRDLILTSDNSIWGIGKEQSDVENSKALLVKFDKNKLF